MHPRSSTAAAAIVSVSILMLAGCGSGKSTAAATVRTSSSSVGGSAGTAGTTAMTPTTAPTVTSTPAPTTPTTPSAATTPTTPQSAGASSTSAGGPVVTWDSCADVDVRIEALPGAASGHTYSDLIVTNHGTSTCTLPAQPKLEYLGADYKPLQVAFSPDPAAPAYRLAPNSSAALSISYGTDGNPPCSGKIAWVQVVSPGHDVPFDHPMHCAHDSYFENHWTAGTYAPPQ